MAVLKGRRSRVWTLALVLMALVLQTFVVGLSSAAMAANGARAALINADLAPLGLTLADLPCHSGLQPGLLPGEKDGSSHQSKKGCPACQVQIGGAALLPVVAGLTPTEGQSIALAAFEAVILAIRAATLGQARAPPAA
jgi:hypothetical protein